ncbi:hypothetical protein OEZ74_26755, partial [Leclercia adecarboxylata]|uniref:hypothetical protein n=1 Tax=Leclercia adecarboxylata TaxID=83655 RepID=UPI00234C79C7
GLISVDQNPTIDSKEPLYLDGLKYADLITYKQASGSIVAFTYPDELLRYEGVSTTETYGVLVGGQPVTDVFYLAYETLIANDVDGIEHGKKIHLLYNVSITPQASAYVSVSEDIDPTNFTWEYDTIPLVG